MLWHQLSKAQWYFSVDLDFSRLIGGYFCFRIKITGVGLHDEIKEEQDLAFDRSKCLNGIVKDSVEGEQCVGEDEREYKISAEQRNNSILLVNVENIHHEPFQQTQELKVCNGYHCTLQKYS